MYMMDKGSQNSSRDRVCGSAQAETSRALQGLPEPENSWV